MMKRRDFISLLGGAAAWPLAARAQQPGKVSRVGFLGTSSLSLERHLVEAFLQKLRELGYVEGKTIAIEYRWAEGQDDRLPDLAADLARVRPDVIVTSGTPGTLAAKRATATIPIVFASSGNPINTGLVASFVRPGGNVTGFTISGPELEGKRCGREYVESAGLMSYGPNRPDLFRRAGDIADKILRGAKPSEIPVEQPTKFDLIINLTAAKALHLKIPESFLLRADEVIE